MTGDISCDPEGHRQAAPKTMEIQDCSVSCAPSLAWERQGLVRLGGLLSLPETALDVICVYSSNLSDQAFVPRLICIQYPEAGQNQNDFVHNLVHIDALYLGQSRTPCPCCRSVEASLQYIYGVHRS